MKKILAVLFLTQVIALFCFSFLMRDNTQRDAMATILKSELITAGFIAMLVGVKKAMDTLFED